MNYSSPFKSGALSFDPKRDIIGLTELMIEINKLSEEKLQKILEYIDHSIFFETSEKDIGSAFLTNQYKTVYSLCLTKLEALGIKEATANTIIQNGIINFSYDFPDKVNYLIGEFGCGKSHTLYLYYLHLYNLYKKTTNLQMPVFLNANILSPFESIQLWAQEQKVPLQNCILIFDDLASSRRPKTSALPRNSPSGPSIVSSSMSPRSMSSMNPPSTCRAVSMSGKGSGYWYLVTSGVNSWR